MFSGKILLALIYIFVIRLHDACIQKFTRAETPASQRVLLSDGYRIKSSPMAITTNIEAWSYALVVGRIAY